MRLGRTQRASVGVALAAVAGMALVSSAQRRAAGVAVPIDPVVFVSRQIPPNGSIYMESAKDLPGVGARSRFRVAAPGQLIVREPDGRRRVLVDGANPTAASKNLIDVNAPDVSYDGAHIVFAGLPNGKYDRGPVADPGAWRLYVINADGTGLAQVTQSDQELDLSQFGAAAVGLRAYDDTDPAWLPDGRLVFTSTRWPSFGHYSGVRTTNLYVINPDGRGLHRITAERNGADRPLIDPQTGQIVFSRWWRNHRFALDDRSTVASPNGGYVQKDGLSANRDLQLTGAPNYANYLWRNVWNPAVINPDGTELKAWGGSFLQQGDGSASHVYGGAFTPDGTLYVNFFPMFNMTEAAGFGGIRRATRGPEPIAPLLGVTKVMQTYVRPQEPISYGVYPGPYAAEPAVLSDGTLVISMAPDVNQDYGLYRINADGSGPTLLYDGAGTSELRARSLRPRVRPPIIPDHVSSVASLLPPSAQGPYDGDGTFIFDALNVYANAPVDVDIVSAPPIGTGATLRFFIDHQRTSPGSYPNLDWPILLSEKAVSSSGAVRHDSAPADVPLFEQLRDANDRVPLTRAPNGEMGATHVAGMNFGRPGSVVRCVGCHIGHSMIPVPTNDDDAAWTNLAPGATVTASSSRTANGVIGLVDRRAAKAQVDQVWSSEPGKRRIGQWIELRFPVPIRVRTVRLYAPAGGSDGKASLDIQSTRVTLLGENQAALASSLSGDIQSKGTDVSFDGVVTRSVKVEFLQVSGQFLGESVAALAEIEVIGRGVGP